MTPNEISHYESLKKQDIGHRKLIKKLQLNKKALKEQLIVANGLCMIISVNKEIT